MAAAAHAARNNKHKRREEMKASAREGFKDSRKRVDAILGGVEMDAFDRVTLKQLRAPVCAVYGACHAEGVLIHPGRPASAAGATVCGVRTARATLRPCRSIQAARLQPSC